MKIEQTTDYEQFLTITSNRELDEAHVRKLMKAIQKKNLLPINAITCNKKMEVIDGQHRLEAATRLKLPVFYIVSDDISKSDIASLNSNAKNWTVLDYINYWSVEKRPGFDKLSAFLFEHPTIPASSALCLLSSIGKRDLQSLRDGIVDVDNYDHATKVAVILKFYRNLIDFAYDRNFILAVSHCVSNPDYDHEIMKSKIAAQSRSLVKCINRKQYLELLEEIYNRYSSKNRIKLT